MALTQICPWCNTEIVWDEEIGPETECPHCYNELTDYRTVTFPLKPELPDFDEDSDDDWNQYTRTAEKILDAQDEALECPQCQEYMVKAGEMKVDEKQFMPLAANPELPPFLEAPFRIELFVCSHCFAVLQRLGSKDRNELIRRLGETSRQEMEP